jgi:hypothetical protein
MKQTATYYSALCKIIGCCLFFLSVQQTHAQTRGTLEIVKDPRIDTLAARRLEAAKTPNAPGGSYSSGSGYRVQFFSGSSRADAYKAQERMNEKYPELRTYISYREPDFKVRAGDFRTRLEATKLMQELRPYFTGLFVIQDKINPPTQ